MRKKTAEPGFTRSAVRDALCFLVRNMAFTEVEALIEQAPDDFEQDLRDKTLSFAAFETYFHMLIMQPFAQNGTPLHELRTYAFNLLGEAYASAEGFEGERRMRAAYEQTCDTLSREEKLASPDSKRVALFSQ